MARNMGVWLKLGCQSKLMWLYILTLANFSNLLTGDCTGKNDEINWRGGHGRNASDA